MRILARLFRLPLALMNGAAAAAGYLLFPSPAQRPTLLAVFLGVALLAAAGSALNQVMERDLDALMRRTCDRPLPTGKLTPAAALLAGLAALSAGAALLSLVAGTVPAAVSLFTLLWYLALYTPLKRVSSLALLVGGLCGCGAPLVGWSAAGGGIGEFPVILLAGVIYLWQVPHFWQLQRKHADDYRRAGFPVFTPPAGADGCAPLCRLWMAAMVAGTLMLPLFGVVRATPLICTILLPVPLLFWSRKRWEPFAGLVLHCYPLLVTLAIFGAK
ncbi:protoheme IX farnesyltransferase [Citrifermentans bemidjiense Bem]|uniref:Protoheme IX farnesyltransferase n=2 Tax=Citrifermentans bemidjiense TaxID=225194 RepID=B5EJ52_CITBB|nr:protoheme IX farnesyltransferase [Citrifermentans bemidjiense Bem]